ncbi:MAG: prolipoprotein diacylglyceryl transferase family protein [Candidatus Binatia bacterium]
MTTISSLILVLVLSGTAVAQRTTREDLFSYLVKDGPTKGNGTAPITVIEFSDFQCSFCRKFWKETLPSLEKKYIETGKVVLWALAAMCAGYVIRLELKRYRLNPEFASSIVFTAIVGGLLGARLLLILEEWDEFLRSPGDLILSGAGFSWYGGLIGGTIAVTWWVRRHGILWLKAADISAPALALGYGIGRIGCFLAGDATWGKVTAVPWAMAFPAALAGWADPLTGVPYPPGVKVHPTQLYELVLSLFVFSVLWILRKRRHPNGTIFWLYLLLASRVDAIYCRVLAGKSRRRFGFDRVSVVQLSLGLAWGLSPLSTKNTER